MVKINNNATLFISSYAPLIENIELLLAEPAWEQGLELWLNAFSVHQVNCWIANCISNSNVENSDIEKDLFFLIDKWFFEPDDTLRRALFSKAEKIGFDSPVTLLALSIFWSEGSMSPEEYEPVYPDVSLSRQICKCILLTLACEINESPQQGLITLFNHWKSQGMNHV